MRISYSVIARRAVLALALAPAAGATAAQTGMELTPVSREARAYSDCMALARSDPRAAHKSALAWHAKDGGDPALHCAAVALLGLGDYDQAASMLETLAGRADAKRPELRAGLLAQAANAWLIAGKPKAALAAQNRALEIRPGDPAILTDRSIARTSLGRDWDALDDLNRVLEIDPDRIEALVFRAAAWRRVEAWELALQDVDRALGMRPENPDALMERALIRLGQGNRAGARADWLRVVEITVDGPLRDAARRNLEALDLKTGGAAAARTR